MRDEGADSFVSDDAGPINTWLPQTDLSTTNEAEPIVHVQAKRADELALPDSFAEALESLEVGVIGTPPVVSKGGRLGFCGAPGTPCLGGRTIEDDEHAVDRYLPSTTIPAALQSQVKARAEETASRLHGWPSIGFCGLPGTPCLVAVETSEAADGQQT